MDNYKSFTLGVLALAGTAVFVYKGTIGPDSWANTIQWVMIMWGVREAADKIQLPEGWTKSKPHAQPDTRVSG